MKNLIKKVIFFNPRVEYIIRNIVWHIYIKKILSSNKSFTNKGLNLLFVNHNFDQDIESILNANEKHCIKIIDYKKTFWIASCFFKPYERDGDIPYEDKRLSINRNNYKKEANKIVKFILEHFPLDAMILPSDSFFWIREVIYLLKEKNIPTIVIDKEGIISPYFFKVHPLEIRQRFPFISDWIIVWSKRQKDFWMRSGVAENQIKIVGQPRSDFFYRKDKWLSKKELDLAQDKKVVLFFTYDKDAYIPKEIFENGEVSWEEMREETHNVIIKLAKMYPDVQFVVKLHPQQTDISYINKFFSRTHLNNIKIIGGASLSNQLLVNADIIVGFQTTGMIEAMLLDKPILYTFWGNSIAVLMDEIIPFHKSNCVEVIDSPKRLEEKIEYYISTSEKGVPEKTKLEREKFVMQYFHNPDGKTGIRILETIEELVKEYKKNSEGENYKKYTF